MFNDRYGLTQSVLEGKKTMTRRIIKGNFEDVKAYHANGDWHFIADTDEGDSVELKPQYEIGERVAIAQAYKNDDVLNYNAYNEDGTAREDGLQRHKEILESKGYRNKMFVKADYMPHSIRITNIKVERLQAISDDDCLKEGVHVCKDGGYWLEGPSRQFGGVIFKTPREAFAALIDKVSGPNTWHNDPMVIAYTFELIK
jgi:uncharacterized protein YhfF